LNVELEKFKQAIYACIKCNSCTRAAEALGVPETSVCPFYEFNGRNRIFSSQNLWQTTKSIFLGDINLSPSLNELIYQCNTCAACMSHCPHEPIANPYIDTVKLVEFLRSEMVKKGYGVPIHLKFGEHIMKEHNPYMEIHKDRWDWLPNKEQLPKQAEYVFFVGCTSSYRQTQIAKATVNIINKLNLDYTVMWRPEMDEWCCGSPLQRTGQVDKARTIAEHNLEAIKKSGAKKVITSCSGCYKMIAKDYKELYLCKD